MRILTSLLLIFGLTASLAGQNARNFWQNVHADDVSLPATALRDFEPNNYRAFRLDYEALKTALLDAPMEFAPAQKTLVILLPQADGSLEPFSVRQSPIMEPALQAKFPEIRTYWGQSLATPGKITRFTLSPEWGLEAIVRHPNYAVEYVEPLAVGQKEWYRAYNRLDFPEELRPKGLKLEFPAHPAQPSAPGLATVSDAPLFAPELEMEERGLLQTVNMKLYKFAVSCTGEFSQDHGGTTASVLAKVTSYTNKMNIVYEADLDIRLVLVADEDKIIFLDPTNDPFTGSTVGQWAGQNAGILNSIIGFNNYDIGHVFARYISGDAAGVAGGLCCTLNKAAGCSSGSGSYGDPFLTIPGQEIGHQWSGGHTWNYCTANNQWSAASACEPGSGSTVMSYAGACGQYNIVNQADLYYQACSIVEIRTFVDEGIGKTCGSEEPTTNNAPIVTHNYPSGFFIPIETPFELIGSATDPDGDTGLTYCWDETDTGPYSPPGQPIANAPLFRSWPPNNKTNRVFPRLQTLTSNSSSIAEVLPTYTRDLTFRLVVRDNHTPGGGLGWADVAFKSTDKAGPFVVLEPNVGTVVWRIGEYATVKWDVANTDKSLVNCKTVNIRLSTDGGYTYPTTLASNVPNNGIACVLVPDKFALQARVRVEAADNIFFDISNANFKIQDPVQPNFTLCGTDLKTTVCAPYTFTSQISTAGVSSFASPIALSASGLPAGATATFSPATVNPGQSSTLTVELPGGFPDGTYTLNVLATADTLTVQKEYTFVYFNSDLSGLVLQLPADGTTGTLQSPKLEWSALPYADAYEVQVASSPAFDAGSIVTSKADLTTNNYQVSIVLEKGKAYFWRVRAKNECGESAWSEPFSFATLVESCNTFSATDLPKNLSANGTPTIESKITVPSGGAISDVNIKQLKGFHESFKQLELHLISPQGTDVLLFKNKCGSLSVNFNFGLDDAATSFPCPPPTSLAQPAKPQSALAAFIGQNAAGDWKLTAKDAEVGSGGSIEAFQIEFCSASSLSPPFIVNNNVLQVMPGTNGGIPTNLLKAEDANNTAAQLTYTLVTLPAFGRLEINNNAAQPGSTFTQAELDGGALRLYDYGSSSAPYTFRFVVTDGEGGMAAGTFTIQPFPVGTHEATSGLRFALAPNPAAESVRVSLGEAAGSATRVAVFNAAGQLALSRVLPIGQQTAMLDVAALPKGIYTVLAENEKGRAARKLAVQ